MKINLRPGRDVCVRKIRIGQVPTLVLRPTDRPAIPVSVLWIHGGGYVTGMKEMVYMSRAVDLVKKYGMIIIPKSVKPERMAQNMDIWDFTLTDEDNAVIAQKDLGHSEIVDHNNPAFVKMLCGMKIHE